MGQLTETELQKLQLIRKDALEIASILGELEYQKTILDIQSAEQKQKVKALKIEESKFFQDITDKYGNINVNIETGEFQ
jgi:hypothetical protein